MGQGPAHEARSHPERDGLIVLGGFRADQLAALGRVRLSVKASDGAKRKG